MDACNFSRADLTGVQLSGADINNADFTGSYLPKNALKGTTWESTPLEGDFLKFVAKNLGATTFRWRHQEFDLSDMEFSEFHISIYERSLSFRKVNLKRTKWENIWGENNDFSFADCEQAEFESCNFYNAKFRGANLKQASMRESDLKGADLRNANLQETDLRNINLNGADLRGANLMGANLHGANLTFANLKKANLEGASLSDSICVKAIFRRANMKRTQLDQSTFVGADFRRADLTGSKVGKSQPSGFPQNEQDHTKGVGIGSESFAYAKLCKAIIRDADWSCVNLYNADLTGADLTGASLTNANLKASIMRDVTLSQSLLISADLSDAIILCSDFSGADLSDVELFGAILGGNNFDQQINVPDETERIALINNIYSQKTPWVVYGFRAGRYGDLFPELSRHRGHSPGKRKGELPQSTVMKMVKTKRIRSTLSLLMADRRGN